MILLMKNLWLSELASSRLVLLSSEWTLDVSESRSPLVLCQHKSHLLLSMCKSTDDTQTFSTSFIKEHEA